MFFPTICIWRKYALSVSDRRLLLVFVTVIISTNRLYAMSDALACTVNAAVIAVFMIVTVATRDVNVVFLSALA